jgi:hypothetical protein
MRMDDEDPDVRLLADEIRRLEPTAQVSVRRQEFMSYLVVELLDVPLPRRTRFMDALRAFRKAHDVPTEVVVVNSTTPTWTSRAPDGWPPVGRAP